MPREFFSKREEPPIEATDALSLLEQICWRHKDRARTVDALRTFLLRRPTYTLPVSRLNGAADLRAFLKDKHSHRWVATDRRSGEKTYHATRKKDRSKPDWYYYDWEERYIEEHEADMCAFILIHPKGKTPSYVTVAHHNYHDYPLNGVSDQDPHIFHPNRRVTTFRQFVNYEPPVEFFSSRHELEIARGTYDIGFTASRAYLTIGEEHPFPIVPLAGGDPMLNTYIPLRGPNMLWHSGWSVYAISGVLVGQSPLTEINIPGLGSFTATIQSGGQEEG